MPHNWASAEYIRVTINLRVLYHGNKVCLFEDLSHEWTVSDKKL